FGLLLPDYTQQSAIVVGQHFGQRAHGGEPDLWLVGAWLMIAARDGQCAGADGLLGRDADDQFFHDFVSSSTRSTSLKKSSSNCCGLVNSYGTPLSLT